jgi:hypothetical protein
VVQLTAEVQVAPKPGETAGGEPEKFEFTSDTFQRIYIGRGADYGPEAAEVVELLVRAGIGLEEHSYPYPPHIWKKAANAANKLKAWLERNPDVGTEARILHARSLTNEPLGMEENFDQSGTS